MIETLIVTIPALIALFECLRRGPEHAFLDVFLPTLMLVTEHSWAISGQLTFTDLAIAPIALFLLFRRERKWQWTSIDFLVIAYAAITVIAEGMNKGYKLGFQNLLVQQTFSILMPYFAAKSMLRHPQFAIDFAKRVAILLTIVAIVSVYETRMGSDLFTKPFDGIFPPIPNTVIFRAGFMRTQGPFGHAITLGVMMMLGFRLVRWLEWNGEWKEPVPFLPISKIRFVEFWIIAGSMMSLSVSPFLSAAFGTLAVSVLRARNRKRAFIALGLVVAVLGPPAYIRFKNYVSVDPMEAMAQGNGLQMDSSYRNLLIQVYTPVVEERPTWGWGRNDFPIVRGMVSIDNAFLFTALTFGISAMVLQITLFLWPPIRMTLFSLPLKRNDPKALAVFTMVGMYVLNFVIDGTGAAGGATWTMFLLAAGWGSALVSSAAPATATASEIVELEADRSVPRTEIGIRRVMV